MKYHGYHKHLNAKIKDPASTAKRGEQRLKIQIKAKKIGGFMPIVIDGNDRPDIWTSGHEHLKQQGRLVEIQRDLVAVRVTDKSGNVLYSVTTGAPRPTLRQRIENLLHL